MIQQANAPEMTGATQARGNVATQLGQTVGRFMDRKLAAIFVAGVAAVAPAIVPATAGANKHKKGTEVCKTDRPVELELYGPSEVQPGQPTEFDLKAIACRSVHGVHTKLQTQENKVSFFDDLKAGKPVHHEVVLTFNKADGPIDGQTNRLVVAKSLTRNTVVGAGQGEVPLDENPPVPGSGNVPVDTPSTTSIIETPTTHVHHVHHKKHHHHTEHAHTSPADSRAPTATTPSNPYSKSPSISTVLSTGSIK